MAMIKRESNRRPRKRRPTLNPRFGNSSLAYEIGLLRLSMDIMKDVSKEERKKNSE